MALDPAGLKAKMKLSIYNGLKKGYASTTGKGKDYLPVSDAQWMLLAEAISDIAMDIVTEIKTNAQVVHPLGPGKVL